MIYLDNSATTQLDPEVLEAMRPFFTERFGNASSVYELGRSARVALEDARDVLAAFIHADSREVVFTSGGTESNNTALTGPIFQKRLEGSEFNELHIATSAAEHHAVLEPIQFLQKLGVQTDFLPLDSGGHVRPESIESAINTETTLLSLMLVNNEVGSVNEIETIARAAQKAAPNIFVHTDAVQALGKIPINVKKLGVHLASFSAHKIHGPKGIGALFIKSGTKLEPFMHGGAQERNRRGGTESVALAVGFAKAIELAASRSDTENSRIESLGRALRGKLERLPGVVLNSPENGWLPWIINFSFAPALLAKLDGEALLIRFDMEGIAVSNGSACTSGSIQPSHVLLAMGKGEAVAARSIRVSISHHTTQHDLDKFCEVLQRLIAI